VYIHLFAFRLKPGVTDAKKDHIVAEIRKLQGQIPGLLEPSWARISLRAAKDTNSAVR
jgi:hypothetical protein